MPANTISVTRPGKYGNPFYPGSGLAMGGFDSEMRMVTPAATPANCAKWFRIRIENMRKHEPRAFAEYIEPLRGKNLACWCAVGAPCHADILLEVANG
jgi:hypothetical protein